jgi:hypothetical protein
MRGLSIALRETAFSLADPEVAQTLDIFWGVVAPAALITASQRQRSEPFAEPEPTRGYAEFIGALAYRERTLLSFLKHAHIVGAASLAYKVRNSERTIS